MDVWEGWNAACAGFVQGEAQIWRAEVDRGAVRESLAIVRVEPDGSTIKSC